jgi:PAS domain S-box-containing protein
MIKFPETIKDFLLAMVVETRLPAYLLVNDDGLLVESGGELRLYGLDNVPAGESVDTHIPFLMGMLPLDSSPLSLPYVKLEGGLTADIYLLTAPDGTYVILLDATWDARKRRAIQQKANELSLHLYERQQAEEELQQEKDALEALVQERTLDLARSNQSLKRELEQRSGIESALRASEARFRRVFESNMMGVMFWDLSGVITEANDAFLGMIGYTREDLRAGRIRWDYISRPDLRHLDEQAIAEMHRTGKSQPFARQFIRKNGQQVTLLFGAALLEGSQTHTVCFALNVVG